jgi:hypothetical protein
MRHCGCRCPACIEWNTLEIRVMRLEKRVYPARLLTLLTPEALQHVECF